MALNRGEDWEPRRPYAQPQPAPQQPAPPTLQPPSNYRPVNPVGQPGGGGYGTAPGAGYNFQPQGYRPSPGGYGIPPASGYSPTPGYAGPAYGGYGSQGYSGGYPAYGGWQQTQEFSDPTTANFENLLNYQAQHYMQPVYDPSRSQYAGLLQNMIGALSPNDPMFQNYMGTLNSILGEAGGPSPGESMLMSLAGSLAGGGNADAYAQQYRKFLLDQDPYTGAEYEAYRTNALEPIENDRAAAQQSALRRISAQGIDPSSGIALAQQNEIDNAAMQARAGAQNDLAMARVQERANRQGQAFQAGLSAEQLKNQAKSAAASAASGANSAWYNRQGLRAGTAGELANALPTRLAAQLQPAGMLSTLSQGVRNEQDLRYANALQLSQTLAQLPAQRQAEALAAMGMGEDPSGVLNSLGQISGMNANSQALGMQNSASMQQGLGTLLGYLQPALQRGGQSQYRDPGFTSNYLPWGSTPYRPETYAGQNPYSYGATFQP